MIERALLDALYSSLGNWRRVAALIARLGGLRLNKSMWWQIANDKRQPTREQRNAIRACFPLVDVYIPPTARDVVSEYDCRAYVSGENPDTAWFFEAGNATVLKLTAKTADGEPLESPQTRVSKANKKVRAKRDLADVIRTRKGYTGNLEKISECAERAAKAASVVCDLSPDDAFAALHIT